MTFTVVGDPAQVREVMRRTEDFAPTNALTSVVPLAPATLRILSKARFALPPVLASATGERHRAVRTMVGRFFTPAKVAAVAPRVRELARQRLDAAAAGLRHGPVDLADAVARHIPPLIMAGLTGQPIPEPGLLNRWSRDSLELFWGWPDPERQQVLARSAAEFYGWLRGEAAAARGTASLFGVLDAAGLTQPEVCSLGYFLVIAGQETTSLLISTALYRGLESAGTESAGTESAGTESAGTGTPGPGPGGWAGLAEPGRAQAHVRRVLAAESSVHTWRRAAVVDTTLGGASLPAGAEILLELSGHHPAGAGPTAYSLAFGHGLHRCLGARLAELETALVVEETAAALPGLRLAGPPPQWLRLLSFQAPLTVTATQGEP
ncbi:MULTISPECIES: cytochrome P450 [unclassified Arthrobacter]|uniref:cytochrome P450 n=1 Tax=unclassified Arthrobacter TaxID=235627 RepID=UPI00159D05AC|nr:MULTISPECIES: cytochrome P450 [unclassified Arthrobacter]MCQ9165828.1 cytochrome P450 [Arthrobacter sp. STN4]NVM99735.1 cytochrome P450 [Arthrobacter sp. SDTb3-6]